MTRLSMVRLGIATIGLIVWGYGVAAAEPVTRWVGIGLFAIALFLRFAAPRGGGPSAPRADGDGDDQRAV